mgnify:CR=1 FL=1|jgi:hypothetical protein
MSLLRVLIASAMVVGMTLLGGIAVPRAGQAGEVPFGCAAALPLPPPSNPEKATLCHFTGSSSNPFIINEVSNSAVVSHQSHHGDCARSPGLFPSAPDNTVCF